MTRDVVFFHNAGTQPDSWAGVINELGSGITPWLPNLSTGGLDEQLGIVETLLDRNEIREVDCVAFGTGAPAAVLLAARQPQRVRSLLLASPLLHVDQEATNKAARALRWVPGFLFRRQGMNKKELLDQLREGPLNDVAAELGNVTAPTMLLSTGGENDDKQVTATLEKMPRARVRVIGDLGGNWYEDQPQLFSSEVLSFLDG